MKMRYLLVLAVAMLIAIPAVVFAGPPGGTQGKARLHPANQSGVKARITLADDGAKLTVSGTATGLTPGIPYASLVYDNGSVPGGPGNPPPAQNPASLGICEPTVFLFAFEMFIDIWVVDGLGNGTLGPVVIGPSPVPPDGLPYPSLSLIDTVSIRDLTVPNPNPPGFPGSGPAAVVACGQIANQP